MLGTQAGHCAYRGTVIFRERVASGALSAVATRAWFLETEPLGPFEKILPLPFAHLIVNLSTPYRLFSREGRATDVADAFVSGLQTGYLVIESPPRIRHVGLELTPVGLEALRRGSGVRAAGRVQDARGLVGGIDDLVDGLRGHSDVEAALDRMVAWASGSAHAADQLVAAGLDLLAKDPSQPISKVAATLGMPVGTFIARFRAVTGVTPKQHALVLRFHRFIAAAHEAGGMPDWAGLAAAAGYYDQPHVIRAFRRFSGWTPSEYYRLVAEYGPDAAHFVPLDQVPVSAPDVAQARS